MSATHDLPATASTRSASPARTQQPAAPADGRVRISLPLRDQAHAYMIANLQVGYALDEYHRRLDLQDRLVAAKPEFAAGGTEKAWVSTRLRSASGARIAINGCFYFTHADVVCHPPALAGLLIQATLGLRGEREEHRAALAKILPVVFTGDERSAHDC